MNNRLNRTQALPTEKVFAQGLAPIPKPRPASVEQPIAQVAARQRPRLPLRVRLRNLRSGGRWSVFGAAVLVVCWALWAAQAIPLGRGRPASADNSLPSAPLAASIVSESLVLLLILLVALGLFVVSRLVGGVIFEKMFSRPRRGAVLSHLAIGLFLVLAGVSLLRQVTWVVSAWNQLQGMR